MNKILIIQTASIGDVILAIALIESLHLRFPGASIDYLVKKGNESLFHGHPFLKNVITWDKRSEKFAGLIKIIRQIRGTRYDLVVNVQRFFLTGLITVLSGSRETRGFSKNPLSFLFSRSIQHKIGDGIHEVHRNNDLIHDLVEPGNFIPHLYPAASDDGAVDQYIKGNYYTISPASLWFTKQYPVEKWVEFIGQVPDGSNIYLLGAQADLDICEKIISESRHPGILSLAGKLTLLQSAALMKRARMNFTNDSAPMHLASSVNAPVTVVYCSTSPRFGFGPLSSDSSIVEITPPLACRPCGLHGFKKCPEKHFRCAFEIETAKLTMRL
ncbi:MAG: glycosyltransferase family 9 protein [Bacteroidales bacterium]|nr:glycosyltransferase family 9 protein [Bacteroidales bacterium]